MLLVIGACAALTFWWFVSRLIGQPVSSFSAIVSEWSLTCTQHSIHPDFTGCLPAQRWPWRSRSATPKSVLEAWMPTNITSISLVSSGAPSSGSLTISADPDWHEPYALLQVIASHPSRSALDAVSLCQTVVEDDHKFSFEVCRVFVCKISRSAHERSVARAVNADVGCFISTQRATISTSRFAASRRKAS